MKKIILLIVVSLAVWTHANAQFYSVKTNLLGWVTANINAEAGVSIHRNWSLHLPLNYNPWVFPGNKRFQNITVQPGARYWFLESFSQSFMGFHSIYSRYHVGGIGKYRYDGWGAGLGVSYGYSKVLKKRWNIEFEAGAGLIWTDYKKYLCRKCGAPQQDGKKLYLIPSKVSVALVYLF